MQTHCSFLCFQPEKRSTHDGVSANNLGDEDLAVFVVFFLFLFSFYLMKLAKCLQTACRSVCMRCRCHFLLTTHMMMMMMLSSGRTRILKINKVFKSWILKSAYPLWHACIHHFRSQFLLYLSVSKALLLHFTTLFVSSLTTQTTAMDCLKCHLPQHEK